MLLAEQQTAGDKVRIKLKNLARIPQELETKKQSQFLIEIYCMALNMTLNIDAALSLLNVQISKFSLSFRCQIPRSSYVSVLFPQPLSDGEKSVNADLSTMRSTN